MQSQIVAVRVFMSRFEAEVALSALEAAGIEASLRSDDCAGLYPQLSMGAAELLVREEDLARAIEVLDTPPVSSPPGDADRP